MEVFGKIFRHLRRDRDIRQRDIADILHVTDSAVSNWERGQKIPEIPTLIAIARYFDVRIDYLLGLEDEFGYKIEPKS